MEKELAIRKLIEIRKNTYQFLDAMKKDDGSGFKYAMHGDKWDTAKGHYLGASVYVLKSAYVIGLTPESDVVKSALKHVKEFAQKDGYYYDPSVYNYLHAKAVIKRLIKRKDKTDIEYKRAETRQCISVLSMYNDDYVLPREELLSSADAVAFLESLDWRVPWGAGSHFSHVLFFYKKAYDKGYYTLEEYDAIIDDVLTWLMTIYDESTGSWHKGNVNIQQAINGAMKILTGLQVTERNILSENMAQKLVDLCLKGVNDEHACDNFNIIYVLNRAQKVSGDYRSDEIQKFALERLDRYMNFYYDEMGGFSFYQGRSNDIYYGRKITTGLRCPDVHGTCLFLWGCAMVADVLGVKEQVKLYEFTT